MGTAALGEGGLQTSVAVDTVGRFGSEGPNGATNRLDLREAEFMFYAPTDHLFDGMLGLAAHYEDGAMFVEAHGAYLETTKLIPRSRLRIGQFFLGFGKLNRTHRHDWPFISTPKVMRTFFDVEGLLDTGIEYGLLFPMEHFLDLTVGVTNGWNFGHTHVEGNQPQAPTHYARLATFVPLPWQGGMEVGANYVGRTAFNGQNTALFGVDLVAKWREARQVKWLVQGELWNRRLSGGTRGNDLGAYLYVQRYFGSQLFLGVRLDTLTDLAAVDSFDISIPNYYIGIEPTLTWAPSEFTRLRLAYGYRGQSRQSSFVSNDRLLLVQATFILGAHPAHEF